MTGHDGICRTAYKRPMNRRNDHQAAGPRRARRREERAPSARLAEADPVPFWKRKRLDQMTRAEWESLCDGCGRCCLNKLEDEDTGRIYFTDVVCRLFDAGTCRCSDYKNRQKRVPDCVKLTPAEVADYNWLPSTCAYRLLAEGKELMWWHPLVSGDPETVHQAGVSLRGRNIVSEVGISDAQLEDHIVAWPGRVPKAARKRPGTKGGIKGGTEAGAKSRPAAGGQKK